MTTLTAVQLWQYHKVSDDHNLRLWL